MQLKGWMIHISHGAPWEEGVGLYICVRNSLTHPVSVRGPSEWTQKALQRERVNKGGACAERRRASCREISLGCLDTRAANSHRRRTHARPPALHRQSESALTQCRAASSRSQCIVRGLAGTIERPRPPPTAPDRRPSAALSDCLPRPPLCSVRSIRVPPNCKVSPVLDFWSIFFIWFWWSTFNACGCFGVHRGCRAILRHDRLPEYIDACSLCGTFFNHASCK